MIHSDTTSQVLSALRNSYMDLLMSVPLVLDGIVITGSLFYFAYVQTANGDRDPTALMKDLFPKDLYSFQLGEGNPDLAESRMRSSTPDEHADHQLEAGNMSRVCAAFARSGQPSASGQPAWPPYDLMKRAPVMIALETACVAKTA